MAEVPDTFEAIKGDGTPLTVDDLIDETVARLEGGGVGAAQGFEFTQQVPQSVWTVAHPLGFDPGGIVVHDSDGTMLVGWTVQYLTAGAVLRLGFDIPSAGVVRLS